MADSASPAAPDVAAMTPPPKDPLASLAAQLRHASTGTLACLRRHHPAHDDAAAALFDAERMLLTAGVARVTEADRARWMLVLHCLALVQGHHDNRADAEPGAVLHRQRFSEARVQQLVEADPATLADLLPRLARRLAAAGATVNWWPLADLLLHADADDPARRQRADMARHRLVHHFLLASARATPAAQNEAATD